MSNKTWTRIGIMAAVIICVPVMWNIIELAVAIKETPQAVKDLRTETTNGFAGLREQITKTDESSRCRDSNIVVQLHQEISRNRSESYTNFAQLFKKLNENPVIMTDPPVVTKP